MSLGALGVVTAVTLDVVPSYTMRQDVYEDLLWGETFEHLDEIMADGYSVSLFTTWGPEGVDQVWRKRVVDARSETSAAEGAWRGAVPATVSRHPLPGSPAPPAPNSWASLGRGTSGSRTSAWT